MLRLHGSVVRFDVENNDVEEEAEENDEVKMMMLRRRTHPTTGSTLCASLRTRRAHGHFTRATLRENLQEAGPRMEHWSTLIKHRPVLILLDTLSANCLPRNTIFARLLRESDRAATSVDVILA